MARKSGEIIVTNFRGLNVKDNPLNIDDSECQVANNIIVKDGAVECRGGLEVFSKNSNLSGGIPMMTPYYKRDGTKQLVFSNDDDYYYITAVNQTWQTIGDYGTKVDNPYAFQYKDTLVFGTGSTANRSYKYDAVTHTVTDTTIAFVDSNPDTITDTNNGLGGFTAGDIVIVSGSANNDGSYLIGSVAAGTLTLDSGDELTAEAAGASITLTSTGMSLVGTPANSNGDLRFFSMYLGENTKNLIGAGMQTDEETKNSTTVFYTTDPDDWSVGGVIQVGPSDGQDVTGLVQNNNLVVQKERARHYWGEFYEENAGTFAIREFGVENSSGGVNHETIQVIDGDIISLTGKGRSIEGFGLEGTAQGNAKPKQYATNINPILNNINWKQDYAQRSRAAFNDRMAFFSVPYRSSKFNNLLLVGDWDTPTRNMQPSWTTWPKNIGSMAHFLDDNGEQQFYFGDATEPKIYKYNPLGYSDDGKGYTRVWRSKKFSIARPSDWGTSDIVIIKGYMKQNTELFLSTIVDGSTKKWKITSAQIIEGSLGGGGFIADEYIGDGLLGGNGVETDKFPYLAVAQIDNSQRYAKNIEIQLENDGAGQFWSMDYLSINEQINLDNIPARHKDLEGVAI